MKSTKDSGSLKRSDISTISVIVLLITVVPFLLVTLWYSFRLHISPKTASNYNVSMSKTGQKTSPSSTELLSFIHAHAQDDQEADIRIVDGSLKILDVKHVQCTLDHECWEVTVSYLDPRTRNESEEGDPYIMTIHIVDGQILNPFQ